MAKLKIKLEKPDKRDIDPVRSKIEYRERNDARKSRKDQYEEDTIVEDKSDQDMMLKMMGITGFGTTKGKKVQGTDCYGIRKVSKPEYRQYMNRKKGFNRPLSPTREDKKAHRLHKKEEKGEEDK